MRVLQLHCSEFGYEVRKETPVAEHPASPKEERLEDVLVCFICYEKSDEGRTEETSPGSGAAASYSTRTPICPRASGPPAAPRGSSTT